LLSRSLSTPRSPVQYSTPNEPVDDPNSFHAAQRAREQAAAGGDSRVGGAHGPAARRGSGAGAKCLRSDSCGGGQQRPQVFALLCHASS
jgi:hypothetical protein